MWKAAAILLTVAAVGCASVVNTATQNVPVSSCPPEATVMVDDKAEGTTPCVIALARVMDHTLVFKKVGYEDRVFEMKRVTSGWVYGNLLIGGLVGVFTDAKTGAQYEFEPKEVNVVLKPLPPKAPKRDIPKVNP